MRIAYLVGIFGVDVVFDGVDALLGEVVGIDPHQIGDFCLTTLVTEVV